MLSLINKQSFRTNKSILIIQANSKIYNRQLQSKYKKIKLKKLNKQQLLDKIFKYQSKIQQNLKIWYNLVKSAKFQFNIQSKLSKLKLHKRQNKLQFNNNPELFQSSKIKIFKVIYTVYKQSQLNKDFKIHHQSNNTFPTMKTLILNH